MIAVTIGRTFLEAYNSIKGQHMSSKDFLEKEYFELFYNHPKYMQWITNSPFVQMKKGQKPHLLTNDERKEKLEDLYRKINDGDKDASVAIGFPASESNEFATTSGLVSDLKIDLSEDDIYLSWIGGGLGIGVAGGYSIFLNQPDILLKLYEGWKVYRRYLNDPAMEKLAGNKINSWNGQWLNYIYSKDYRDDFDINDLNTQGFFNITEKEITINTVKWSQLFFNLSNEFTDNTLIGYIYSLGQTNKTLGFYPLHFSKARKLINYYKKLFGEHAAIEDTRKYESLYGLHIKRACELGSIGLEALEPEDLRKYFGDKTNLNLSKPNVKYKTGESEEDFEIRKQTALAKDTEKLITYRTYKTWLLAMITKNKEESLEYTLEVAKALLEYRKKATKNDRKNLINTELLGAKSKRMFLEALVKIIKDAEEQYIDQFKELRDRAYKMNTEEFGYLVVLLKFDYAYLERNL